MTLSAGRHSSFPPLNGQASQLPSFPSPSCCQRIRWTTLSTTCRERDTLRPKPRYGRPLEQNNNSHCLLSLSFTPALLSSLLLDQQPLPRWVAHTSIPEQSNNSPLLLFLSPPYSSYFSYVSSQTQFLLVSSYSTIKQERAPPKLIPKWDPNQSKASQNSYRYVP